MSAVDEIAAYLAHLKTSGNRIDQTIFDELPNGEEMTATDELRRLLDERGIEWIGTSFSTPAKGHPTNTSLGEEHHEATFIEYDDGNVLRLFDLTPAQAVDATLGRGTCENVGYYIDSTRFKCSACGYNGWTRYAADGEDRVPNYCPNCGRKVVDV